MPHGEGCRNTFDFRNAPHGCKAGPVLLGVDDPNDSGEQCMSFRHVVTPRHRGTLGILQ